MGSLSRLWVRLRRPAVIVPLTLATLLALVPLSHAGTALVVSRPIAQPDAIVTLASHEWERLPLAAQRAVQNPNAVVILTLPEEVNGFNCHECNHRVDLLIRAGVQPARIHVVPLRAPGTHGEALAVLAFARGQHVRRLLIVTSPYHTRRALATFRAMFADTGAEVGIEPATAISEARPTAWWRTPYDRWYVRYEWEAIFYYGLRYGVNSFETVS